MKATVSVHGDTDSNWELGEQLCLTEEAISENFKYCLYEVNFDIEVNLDGTYELISLQHAGKTYKLKDSK